ncbi:MAG TPA: hypothetical protein VIO37_05705 [Candidatus Dormibacteraeota bacterium]|jgi:hypothetical protein
MSQRRDTGSPAQALEFQIWADLIRQSHGLLHPFLPLLDRGLDAVLHHMTEGRYIPVQIKGRQLEKGFVHLVVQADSLVDEHALLIAAPLIDVPDQKDLVVEEGVFRHLAAHDHSDGHEVYVAAFSMHPNHSHWRPYLVPHGQLAERILGKPVAQALMQLDPELLKPRDRRKQWLGFLGESEVIRRLAQSPRLDLFRPFPDLEMVEMLAHDNLNRTFAGLQVKAATISSKHQEAYIQVQKTTLSLAPTTWLIALAWHEETAQFDGECLLIPAADVPTIAVDDGPHLALNFRPSSAVPTRLDPYRRRLNELDRFVLEACASGAL